MSINPVYKYKNYVDIENIIINEETGYRYSMFIPFKNSTRNENILVIMRNPSKADAIKSDKTINNVLRFCHVNYSGVYIANLFPYYETDSTKVKNFINSSIYTLKMEKNIKVLESLYKEVTDVIIAWGTNNTGTKFNNNYNKIVDLVLNKLKNVKKNIFAIRFASSKNPWHPRNWEESFDLELYEWDK